MNVVLVNYAFDRTLRDPDALLEAYPTLTGWADAAAAAGAHVLVVQAFHDDADILHRGITYRFCRDEQGPGLARARRWPVSFAREAGAGRPDVVHVQSLEFPIETWRLRRALPRGTAVVVQDHGGGAPDPQTWSAVARRGLMRATDAFLFTSQEQADPWRAGGFIAPEQLVYGIPESSTRLRPVDRAEARARSRVAGAPALLWVGRLNANKDPLTILEGFERSLSVVAHAELTMVFAVEELLPEVRARVSASRILAGRVRLVGRVPWAEMPAYYSAADFFVLGSAHEGSGYAVVEACACGAIPVVTDIPSFRALTGGAAVGRLWRRGDAADLARTIVEAASQDPCAERQRVMDHFARCLSWPAIGARAAAIYADVRAQRVARAQAR